MRLHGGVVGVSLLLMLVGRAAGIFLPANTRMLANNGMPSLRSPICAIVVNT